MSKVIPIKPVTSWSFSRYNLYKECPAKFKFKNIDKYPEPQGEAMARGEAIHKLAEDYTKGSVRTMPKELTLFKDLFKSLKKEKAKFIEESWTFRKDWSETTWNDWAGAHLRVKLDAAYINTEHNVLVVIDHKTGKFRPNKNVEYEEQLQLYGLAGLKKFPTVEAVSPRLWYLDEGIVHPEPENEITYSRKDEKYLQALWEKKTKAMLSDTTFKPTPGNACTWCHYKKSNGGPCKF